MPTLVIGLTVHFTPDNVKSKPSVGMLYIISQIFKQQLNKMLTNSYDVEHQFQWCTLLLGGNKEDIFFYSEVIGSKTILNNKVNQNSLLC